MLMKIYSKASKIAVAAMMALPLSANAGVVYQNDFSSNPTNFLILDPTGGNKWVYNSYGTKFMNISCKYVSNAHTANDDYLVTPVLALKKGHSYKLTFAARGQNVHSKQTCAQTEPGFDYSVKVKVGKTNFAEGTTVSTTNQAEIVDEVNAYQVVQDFPSIAVILGSDGWIDNSQYTKYTAEFTVPENGDYRLAFHAYSAGVAIDEMMIEDAGTDATPMPVTVTAVPTQGLSMLQHFDVVLPTNASTGNTLSAITKLEVKRNGEVVKSITENLTPGETTIVIDEVPAADEYKYEFIAYNGEEASDPFVIDKLFVGPDTPKVPANVKFNRSTGMNTVSWDAVTTGVHGKALDDGWVEYEVSRVTDNAETIVASNLKELSFSEPFTASEMTKVSYKVVASYYQTVRGIAGVSNAITVGSKSLPFAESFATAASFDNWEVTTTQTGYSPKKWIWKANSSYPTPTYDKDGGYAYFNSASASKGVETRLISPNLNLNSVAIPQLEFAFWHYTSGTNYKDRMVVEISKDGGDFVQIPGAEYLRYGAKNEWEYVRLPLSDYKDAESVRIAFKGISDNGYDMYLDAIKVVGVFAKDLGVEALTGPASAVAGSEVPYSITVSNNAGADVAEGDYSVKVYVNDVVAKEVPGVAIAANSVATIPFTLNCNASHSSKFEVKAEVEFAGDENPANNESAAVALTVSPFVAPGATNVSASVKDDVLTLTWEPASVASFEPVNSILNLNPLPFTHEDYLADKTICYAPTLTDANGNVWKNIDEDKVPNESRYSVPSLQAGFMMVSSKVNSSLSAYGAGSGVDNGFFVAIAPAASANKAASDWLVSPKLNEGINTLSFYAKSVYSYYAANFRVCYSTEDEVSEENIATQFSNVISEVALPASNAGSTWKKFEFEVPTNAKYVAIHFNGKSTTSTGQFLCVDDINLKSEPYGTPMYNLYGEPENGVVAKVNAEPISGAEFTMDKPAENHNFYVSAVYPKGETAMSAPYFFDKDMSTVSVKDLEAATISVAGRTVSSSSVFSVYTIDGAVVASAVKQAELPAAGIYVVVPAGAAPMKVTVK